MIKYDIINNKRFIITIVEPVGESIEYERASPDIKQNEETTAESITTDLKLLQICIDVRAGKIRSDDIRSAPISRMPIIVVVAVRKAISML